MTRQFLTIVLPFLAPTVAYIVWIYFRQEQEDAEAQGRKLPPWQEFPWAWLVSLGSVLVIAALILFGDVGGTDADTEYRPARYEDGRLIPGEFIEKHEKARD
jgi:cytochrome bd-type quinol oxidase subunit 2